MNSYFVFRVSQFMSRRRTVFNKANWKLGIFWSGNVKAASASLRRTKWRSFFTMLGVIIGVTSVVTVVSLGEGLKQQITGQIKQLGSDVLTIRPGKLVGRSPQGQISSVNLLAFLNTSTLSDRDIVALNKLGFVKSVVPVSFVTSSAKGDSGTSNDLAVIGTTSELASLMKLKLDYGSFLPESNQPNFAVIGSHSAEELFNDRNPYAHSLSVGGSNFVVSGVLAPSSGGLLAVSHTDLNSTIFIPYSAGKRLTGGNINLLQLMVKVEPRKNLDQASAEIRRTLARTHRGQEDFTVLKQSELLDVSNDVVNSLTGFISGIAAISLLVGGIGIMDIMLVAVSERTREIGIRKAIGATNRQILNQFLTEGLVLSVGGGLIGVAAALIINLLLRLYTGLEPVITPSIILLAVVVSVLVGIVFSGAPALKAARKLPIDALRGE